MLEKNRKTVQSVYEKLAEYCSNIDVENTGKTKDEHVYLKEFSTNDFNFIKNHFHYDVLKNIKAFKSKENQIQLEYTLYNPYDKETLIMTFINNNNVLSIQSLFDNAKNMEKEISEKFNICFQS